MHRKIKVFVFSNGLSFRNLGIRLQNGTPALIPICLSLLQAGLYTLQMESKNDKGTQFGIALNNTEIWGLPSEPSDVRVGGNQIVGSNVHYDPVTKVGLIS